LPLGDLLDAHHGPGRVGGELVGVVENAGGGVDVGAAPVRFSLSGIFCELSQSRRSATPRA
jgi:hypothetical protein